jgi:putative tryptophan/tyrosine transport system substrate-binding protein
LGEHLRESRAAQTLRVDTQPIEIGEQAELEAAIVAAADEGVQGLVVLDHSFFNAHAAAIAALASQHKLITAGTIELARAGGLIGYGVNFSDLFRRAASIVDKILKGAKAGDIPIEQATKFQTIVNLETARALGLDLPTEILARADEVIE